MRAAGMALLAAMVGLLAGLTPAQADSLQELPVYGLGLTREAGVLVDSEDVAVTLEAVDFRYQLSNAGAGAAAVDVLVRLPDVDLSDPDQAFAFPTDDPVNFLGLALTVDGRPADLPLRQSAWLGTKDVTRRLREANLLALVPGGYGARIAALAPDKLAGLIAEGLLHENGAKESGSVTLQPAWSLRTAATLHQRVTPGQPVTLALHARASTGASQDTVLRKALRQEDSLAPEADRMRKTFCVDDAFLGGLDRLAGAAAENAAHLGERRLDIRLPAPRPGDPPVGAFHLSLDKGRPDTLVSTCLDALHKTGGTSFETAPGAALPPHGLRLLAVGRF